MMLASYGLSKRETEVTQLVLLGLPVKRIAYRLGISPTRCRITVAPAVADPCGLLHPVQRHVQQQGADHPALWSPLQGRGELALLHPPRLQPCPDRFPCREGAEPGQKLVVIDVVERPGQVGVEDPLALRALAVQRREDHLDRVMSATPRPESVGSRLEAGLPLGLQRILHPCLLHAVRDDRDGDFILILLSWVAGIGLWLSGTDGTTRRCAGGRLPRPRG